MASYDLQESIDSKLASATILVVDDQPVIREIMLHVLKPEYQVFTADNGNQALQFCLKHQPDLVIMDVNMPGLNGLETCKRMQADDNLKHIPVLFLTGSDIKVTEQQCWDAGCKDFLIKPVQSTTLKYRVRAQLTMKLQADALREMVYVDGLTGVKNRRFYEHYMKVQIAQADRTGKPFSLILLDVDKFKAFNDNYGHLAGDDCLKTVACTINSTIKRPIDVVARYGGEEFACLLPETDAMGALRVAEKLQHEINELAIAHEGADNHIVTVSMGIATRLDKKLDELALQTMADDCLYQAKRRGRNTIVQNGAVQTDKSETQCQAVA